VKALVVGGGIGGLTAGIALRRAGVEVELYERAPAIGEVGAGISMWPNAIRVLDELGVGERVRALGCSQGDGAIRTADGRTMLAVSMTAIERECGAPVVMLHRAALIEALRQGFRGHGLHLGCELVDVEQDQHAVRARFANGMRAEGDVLIGADGWRSVVRAQTVPGARAVYTG
jgi:FAD-dependent urate hydroxylase